MLYCAARVYVFRTAGRPWQLFPTGKTQKHHVRLELSGKASAWYPDWVLMSADHVEQYHWVVKSRPAVKARWRVGVEAWIVERRHPCYPIGRVRQTLFGPWLVICRFDRLLAISALCLHLKVANQLLRCRDRARWPTSHLQASAATNDFCFDMLGSMSTRQGQASH